MKLRTAILTFTLFLTVPNSLFAADPMMELGGRSIRPSGCDEMSVWNFTMGMCMPRAMEGMPMSMLMLTYNSFFTQSFQEGPRGTNAFSVPNMFMLDLGRTFGGRHYVNVDLMGTFEVWTLPNNGYPELLQIGERNRDHQPYIDAQHPHSSPIMGLTLSDTISIGAGRDHAKIWFSPRGPSTDGPIAFMHRPTGIVNPDAPLGHHVGQDVGHISSTVLGASVRLEDSTLEISSFNGSEPEPTNIDLPLGRPNSYAARAIHLFTPHVYSMASVAYVKNPEPDEPELDHVWRYSASVYLDHDFENGWRFDNALIYGLINDYDHAAALTSVTEEAWLRKGPNGIWGRAEVLQRTPDELKIESTSPSDPRWVTALTVGYTYTAYQWSSGNLSLGSSLTKYLLPGEYRSSYGGDPLTARIFLQAVGMGMRDL